MKRYPLEFRNKAISLRNKGMTYPEIVKRLGTGVPKGTLNYWLRNVPTDVTYKNRVKMLANEGLVRARTKAAILKKAQTSLRCEELTIENQNLFGKVSQDPIFYKIILVSLYWAEGGKKSRKGSLMFGNSDPELIKVFLATLRRCYKLDESKFRVTVQCRADSNIPRLETFWRKVTGINKALFYKAQIDPRTLGKPTTRMDYMGVCRINYFSADIFNDIIQATKVLSEVVT